MDDHKEKFILEYPAQMAREFKFMLLGFRNGRLTRRQIMKMMREKVGMALNTIRPVRTKKRRTETLSEKIMRGRTQGCELRNKRDWD